MRTLLLIFATVFIIGSISSQDFPETPKTPTSRSNDKHTSVTTSVSNSTSISNSNKTYKFKSKFQASKRDGISSILRDELDALKMVKKGNELSWVKHKNNEIVFECTLSKRNLHILSNKKELSATFNAKIKSLGEELSNFIAAHKPFVWKNKKGANTITSAQLRLERAKEELQESIKNLKKVKRNRGY